MENRVQYQGKCKHCNSEVTVHLPERIDPKYCTKCGKPMSYSESSKYMKSIPTLDLIRELNSRDLYAELSEEKRGWLEKNGFRVCTDLQFINLSRSLYGNMGYGLEFLMNHSLEELRSGDEKIKSMIKRRTFDTFYGELPPPQNGFPETTVGQNNVFLDNASVSSNRQGDYYSAYKLVSKEIRRNFEDGTVTVETIKFNREISS